MSRDILELEPPAADARLPYGPDPNQFGDLRRPGGAGPHPVLVVMHGGFWRARYSLDHIGHLCADLTARGIATWSLEYRRLGNLGGGWPGTFQDVAAGVDALQLMAESWDLDLGRVASIGHSAGGHLALWLAARHRIPNAESAFTPASTPLRGAVSLAGVVDLRRAWELGLSDGVVEEFLGGAPARHSDRYRAASPIELLPLGVPQALVHGTADANVPFEISERYHARAIEAGDDVRLLTLPGSDHFAVIDPRVQPWPSIVDAVLPLLET